MTFDMRSTKWHILLETSHKTIKNEDDYSNEKSLEVKTIKILLQIFIKGTNSETV